MSKGNNKMMEDGQNRCRRCDRPLSDTTANYGSWCAQIVGANKYNEIASMLDENAMEMYNRYMVDYLSKDSQTLENNVAIVSYNDQEPKKAWRQGKSCSYMEAGKRMFQYAADIFSNPGHYNVILYKGGQQCDYMVQQILAAGGIEYEKKVFPNNSFELFRTGKTHWEN